MDPCKIHVDLSQPIPKAKVFNFTRNNATDGGKAIYGADLDHPCLTLSGELYNNLSDFISISSFSPSFDEDNSVISSDPWGLKLCDRNTKHYCYNQDEITGLSVYPGQVFNLSVALIGDMGGYVRYPLYVTVDSGELGNPLQASPVY